MKLKAVIFDLDGTILDTLEDLKNSVNFALNENGMPERTYIEVRSFVGNGIRRLIERSVPDGTPSDMVDKCLEDFRNHYKLHSADTTKPYDGILPLLSALRSRGYRLAVVSNKADFAVQTLVAKYFPDLFDFAVGDREGINRKPSPDSVYEAMRVLDVTRDEVVYVGDSEVDIETSRNAQVPCVAVTWGFRDKCVLEGLGPEYIIDKPSLLTEVLSER